MNERTQKFRQEFVEKASSRMNGNRSYAWAVAVAKDDSIESALATAETLRRTDSSAGILAIVSNLVSKSFISQLDIAFDLIIVKDVESLATKLGSQCEVDSLLVSALGMTTFSKLAVVRPGIRVLRQSDKLFDSDNLIMLDDVDRWGIAVVLPNKKTYLRVVKKLDMGSFVCASSAELMNLIFFGKWNTFSDKWVVYKEGTVQNEKRKDNLEDCSTASETYLNYDDMDSSDWIAIVGMSCRFPDANSTQEYWDILLSGRNACTLPSDHRTTLVDLDPQMKANFLKCPIDQFDAPFFGFSPSEATFTDPQARLLLEVSYEAFEDASINPDALKGTPTGVFYGSWLQEYRDAMNAEGLSPNEEFIRRYLGNSFGCSAAKLSFFYGFTGPNVSTESGCSSSMVAVDLAVKSLQNRECPVALVCGANVLLHMNLKQKVLWSEKSRTFDADACGYARAEGVAVLILKRFSDAKRDGDKVHAVIRGSWVTQEGLSKSFGTPTVDSECAAMKGALRKAKLEPWEVDYVEAHATGTAVGDPIEAQAIVKAYSVDESSENRRVKPLYIGSGKTNIGHTESCSGLAGILKVVLALKHELIPAHLNLNKLNPQVNFESIPGIIPVDAVPWPRDENFRPRIAGVSSFGISGSDVHVILQEAPQEKSHTLNKMDEITNTLHLLTISAKSETALEELTQKYVNYLEKTEESIEHITFTANTCRPHHPLRIAVLGRSKLDLATNLSRGNHSRGRMLTPKICFTFPGRIGLMDLEPARILYKTNPTFKATMDYCDNLFLDSTGNSMIHLLTDPQADTISKGVTWYALIPAVQYSLVKLWNNWGIYPDCVMGHCIGEISAAVVSGALRLEDLFKLVKCMEYFLQVGSEQPALMMAIQASLENTEKLISSFMRNNENNGTSWIDVVSTNTFEQTVVAGDTESIGKFKIFLNGLVLRCKIIQMDFCAHSRAVQQACKKSLKIFEGISHQKMKIPYVSSVTGQVMKDDELDGHYWYRVFRHCVKFTESCRTTGSNGMADVYIEMGLEGALSRLTQENLTALEKSARPPICLPSLWKVNGDKCWVGLLTSLGQLYTVGGNISWNAYFDNQGAGYYKKVNLPRYPFQRKSYWFERRKKKSEVELANLEQIVTNTIEKRLHPLLGVSIETCVDDPRVFQNWMSKDDMTKYIYDHVIGTQVIFPGAAFLEVILAAVDQIDCVTYDSIHVEDFTVSRPLWLAESSPKRMQCVIDRKNQTGSVYAWNKELDNAFKWKLHSHGKYKVGPAEMDTLTELPKIEDIKRRCRKESGVGEFYLAAKKVELNFGDDFQSMKRMFQNEEGTETLIVVQLPVGEIEDVGKGSNYICHPILIDAMIQGLMLHKNSELKKLQVPVKIGKFSVRKGVVDDRSGWYVYCKTENDSGLTKHIYLINQTDIVAATMTSVDLVMTSVESVHKAAGCFAKNELNEIKTEVLNLNQFEVVWKRSKFHQSGNSIRLQVSVEPEMRRLLDNLEAILTKKNGFSEKEIELDVNMNRLCHLYIVKAMYDFGWSPSNGIEFFAHDAVERWKVLPGLVPAFKHFISHINANLIAEVANNYEQLLREINESLVKLDDYPALKTVQACGSQLAEILQGTLNPHLILFGGSGDSSRTSLAEHYYKNTRFAKVRESLEDAFKIIYKQILRCRKDMSQAIRILEVGAGTGAFAAEVRKFFGDQARGIKYEYTFTDISSGFLVNAREKFKEEPFIFKTFNIENDPLRQGFCPEYFDMVVGMDVIHATRNVKESLSNLELVTKPGGWIILAETERSVMEVDICFGIFEGYWLFEDGIRKEHCTLNGDKWLELLHNSGFTRAPGKFLSCNSQMSVITAQKEHSRNDNIVAKSCCLGNWLVFIDDDKENCTTAIDIFTRKMNSLKRNVTLVPLSKAKDCIINCLNGYQNRTLEGIIFWMGGAHFLETAPDSQKVLEPLLHAGKYLLQKKLKVLPRFHLVTDGCLNTVAETEHGLHSYGNPHVALAWGFMRSLRIELPGILSKSIDLEKGADVHDQCLHVVTELWLDDKETEVAFRGGLRYLRRALLNDPSAKEINVGIDDNCRYFTLELPGSKMISDVKFVKMEEPTGLASDEILVMVKSVSLNFKDVLTVMKPSPDFEQLTSIGLDFSGVVTSIGDQVTMWKIGQPVFGCGWEQGAMKSHVVTKQEAVVPMPNWMTFNEAATLPAVWLTAWYCMVEVAALQKGQTVLIHAASGGVGLIAIQIAKLLGVHVIGTAGTEKKRSFVKSLGVEHVFNSRNTEFGKYIQEITNGNGVDMVLNCLTGVGFKEASLEVCRDGGHFVEISKLDIWTPAQVKEKRPSVNYTIVDVTQVNRTVLWNIMNKLIGFLANGSIKSLPYTHYPSSAIKDALAYLQKAKQIGKVILTMPEFVEKESVGKHTEYLFNDRSSYLITGGKGAIGLAVAKWMLKQGAKYLVLASRSAATCAAQQAIDEMKTDFGATVICKELDVADLEQCRNLIAELSIHSNDIPPLRGIHHCAGILSDNLISNYGNWPSYESVIRPKVQGAWNLHQLTKHLPMEFFVLFSSAASTFGNIGQSSYVAANSYLDSLAEMRVAMGLPCLSINWGLWSVGFGENVTVDWLHPFTPDEGLASLENLLRDNTPPTIVSGLFDFHGLLNMAPYYNGTLLETLCLDQASFFGRGVKNSNFENRGGNVQKVRLIQQYHGMQDEEERRKLVRDFVLQILCEILGTTPEEMNNDDQHFSEMGMDSLMSIEFANKINSELEGGSGGGFIDLEEYGTVSKMTVWINETLQKLKY